MLENIKVLLTSKRAMITLITAVFNILILFRLVGADTLTPEVARHLATTVTVLAGVLIVGISASDTGKALGKPPGIDHKDRGEVEK